MRLIATALLAAVLFTTAALSQGPNQPSPQHLATMKKLDFLLGEWKGEAWTDMGQGKQYAVGTEVVQSKLNGTIVVVEGAFKRKDTGEPAHNAFGVFSFNPRTDLFRFHAFTSNGQMADAKVAMVDKGFDWSFEPTPGILIKYKMRIDEKGEWVEKGEYTREGKTVPFFEMRLQKVK